MKEENGETKKSFWKDKKNIAIIVLIIMLFSVAENNNSQTNQIENSNVIATVSDSVEENDNKNIFENRIADLESKNQELQNQINEVKTMNDELSNTVNSLKTEKLNLENEVKEVTSENGKLQNEVKELASENGMLKNKVNNSSSQTKKSTATSSKSTVSQPSTSYTVYITNTR